MCAMRDRIGAVVRDYKMRVRTFMLFIKCISRAFSELNSLNSLIILSIGNCVMEMKLHSPSVALALE